MAQEVSVLPIRARPPSARAREKVLVVDDDEHFRVLARSMLEQAGFEVIEAGNMDQCLSQLGQQEIGAVILDMVMPDGDGIEAVLDLKRRFPSIRILAVSGADQRDVYLSVSAHLGADASLEKTRISALCPLLQVVLDR